MMRRKFLVLPVLAVLAQLPLLAAPAAAQQVGIEVGVAPPPLRAEAVPPPPSAAHVWVPGHWQWNGVRWGWHRGHYARRPTPAAYWVQGAWVPMPNGHWRWAPGHWARG